MKQIRLILTFLLYIFTPAFSLGNSHSLPNLSLLDDTFNLLDPPPLVISATRLKQPRSETPASVTILDSKLLHSLGIATLPEALRLVPGMVVGYDFSTEGHNSSVSYHGTEMEPAVRQQVLIDGRSVYLPGLARVKWEMLPIAIEDIAKIEVIRGPASATYGANSFLGVINIVTKHPDDYPFSQINYARGSNGLNLYSAHQTIDTDSTQIGLHFGGRREDGFVLDRYGTPTRDKLSANYVRVRSETTFSNTNRLSIHASYLEGNQEEDRWEPFIQSDPDIESRDYSAQGKWTKIFNANHQAYLRAYHMVHKQEQDWLSCVHPILVSPELRALYLLNPTYVDSLLAGEFPLIGVSSEDNLIAQDAAMKFIQLGGEEAEEVCGFSNQNLNESRTDYEIQDIYRLSDAFRFVTGFSFRKDVLTSETYVKTKRTNEITRAFTNAEYRINDNNILNISALFEDDQQVGATTTPRIALNSHINKLNHLRFIYAKAYRSPDIFLQQAEWSYSLSPLLLDHRIADNPSFYPIFVSQSSLQHEQIISKEVGYYGHTLDHAAEWDVKFFKDKLYDLISGSIQIDSDVSNREAVTMTGIEIEAKYHYDRNNIFNLNYGYIDSDATLKKEEQYIPQHNFYFAWIHSYSDTLRIALSQYYSSFDYGTRQTDYTRTDINIHKTLLFLKPLTAFANLKYQRLIGDDFEFNPDSYYETDERLIASLSLSF